MPAPLIVAVDDDQVILDLYHEALEDEGYRIVSCITQHDAIASVKRARPDLVILDLIFGTSIGGWEIFQILSADPSTATIPVIFSTAASRDHLEQLARLQPSPVAILHKPFHIADLVAAIEAALVK
jgi:CheY-like chemotaxis protein